jgi:hypothetical protein
MPSQQLPEWLRIKQDDFSLGVNWVDDPADMDEKEVADARNMRLTSRKIVEQRLGYTQYNASAIGASTHLRSLYQFRDFSEALIPLAQTNGDALYKGDTAFPGTGGAWTSILSETAGSSPAFMDAMWGTLIYTNGIDVPKIWEGTYGKCYGFRKTIDSAVTYYTYTDQVSDEDSTTYAQLGALDTVANGDWVLVKSRVPKLTGFKVVMGANVNTQANTAIAVHYWDGSAWQAVSGLDDTTDVVATKTLSGSGNITFTEATTTEGLFGNEFGYFWRISVDAALSSNVRITALYLYYNIQTLPSVWDQQYRKCDGFVKSIDTNVTFIDYTVYVTDSAMSTVGTLGAFPITTGYFYIKSFFKFRAAKITMSVTNVNTTTATMTAEYWNGAAWAALTISDGTSANSKTLAQTGVVSWTWPTATEKTKVGQDQQAMYIIRFAVSATLSANVDVAEVDIIEYTEPLKVHTGNLFHKNRVFMYGRADAKNYLFYSAAFKPDVWGGTDAGYIGVPSGKPITAIARFYNELMVATDDEIYLLEGYTPATFGLLKISTGGVGVSAPHSVVSVAKMVYFMHATGFYRFDGIGVVLISKSIRHMFDDTQTSYFIPASRYASIQGRFNRVWNAVEWTVSKGSSQTTNNLVLIFDVEHEGWWMDDIVACSLLQTSSSTYQDLFYHGDYTGKVHRDYNGTSDNGTAISAYLTTRGYQEANYLGWLSLFRGMRAKLETATAGTVTVTYAQSGATSFTSLGSLSLIKADYTYVMEEYFEPLLCTSIQLKLAQATKDYSFSISEIELFITPVRYIGVDN